MPCLKPILLVFLNAQWRTVGAKIWWKVWRELSFYPEIKMTLKDAMGSNQQQIKQIQGFIDEKVDLIIASPNESNSITPIIEKAYNAGIPVILIDRRITSEKFTAFVGADNYLVGQNSGAYANQLLRGRGNILEIGSGPNTSPSINRHTGFTEVIAKYKNIQQGLLWTTVGFADTLANFIKTHPPIDLIFAHNDRLALEIYNICEALKLPK